MFLVLFSGLAAVFFTFGSGSYFWNQEISTERLFRVAVADTISLFGATILGVIYRQWRKEQTETDKPSEKEETKPWTGD